MTDAFLDDMTKEERDAYHRELFGESWGKEKSPSKVQPKSKTNKEKK